MTALKLRKEFEEKLQQLQDRCIHKEAEWMDSMWAPGHMGLPVKVCVCCEKIIERVAYEL